MSTVYIYTEEQYLRIHTALRVIKEFFIERDRMNSHVHLQEPRWSPITLLAQEAAMIAPVMEEREDETPTP